MHYIPPKHVSMWYRGPREQEAEGGASEPDPPGRPGSECQRGTGVWEWTLHIPDRQGRPGRERGPTGP